MLEKVAECLDTKSFSCSSRLQEVRSMSQERIPEEEKKKNNISE